MVGSLRIPAHRDELRPGDGEVRIVTLNVRNAWNPETLRDFAGMLSVLYAAMSTLFVKGLSLLLLPAG
jgi:hypothetical protein